MTETLSPHPDQEEIPLFPLNALVCPGGRLPLRIFEPRYLDMVVQSMRHDRGFVIVLLREGKDTDSGMISFYQVGTLARIIDFDQSEAGVLDITVEGQCRVHISAPSRRLNGLWVGQIETQDDEQFVPLPDKFDELKEVLRALVQHPMIEGLNLDIDYQDGCQIGWRLTEFLPLENHQKQSLLEMNSTIRRLETLSDQISIMAS